MDDKKQFACDGERWSSTRVGSRFIVGPKAPLVFHTQIMSREAKSKTNVLEIINEERQEHSLYTSVSFSGKSKPS